MINAVVQFYQLYSRDTTTCSTGYSLFLSKRVFLCLSSLMSQNVQKTSREARLRRQRELYRQRVARETTEQKEARLARRRERYAARRAELRPMESDDQREERLARRREVYAAQSDDQREDRLARRREVYAAQSDDQREDRLARRREVYAAQSDDQREDRLARRREVYADDQREYRLARRREVYAAQSDDQREEGLARRREDYAAQSNHQRKERLPRTQQIHDSRLIKFHDSVSSMAFSKCDTCLERFPNLSVTTQANAINKCIRCGNDKDIPKLFSSANNMDPGAVPPQLQV